MNGLKDRTRRELMIRAVKDLDKAMAIATYLRDFDSIQNVLSITSKQEIMKKNSSCKGKGHYANQCKGPIKKINQIDISNSDTEEYEIEQINTLTNSPNHILQSKALINGIELTGGFDCGATVSVLSHDIAVKNNIEIIPSDFKVKTATRLITKVCCKTSPLKVVGNNHICMIEFAVLDHDDNEVLIRFVKPNVVFFFNKKKDKN
ncbi:unnamed protein product [Brachionus calyciflorus]|uniref:Uncharacterized protein n=1 Tax=Brachionus calyciflorus TaxID=104777 RepID=A0A814GAN7_9BILA|nr:unnamed protein product [Brachionus calyciflorus]